MRMRLDPLRLVVEAFVLAWFLALIVCGVWGVGVLLGVAR